MAVVVGMGGRPTSAYDEFAITDLEREEVEALIEKVDEVLGCSG